MKLFGFLTKKENNKFRITKEDRFWVEQNFKWLIQAFGYPYHKDGQISFTAQHFPNTYKPDTHFIENIIKDLCSLLYISESKITYEISNDIRDSYGIPYSIEGKPFETDIETIDGTFKLIIANSLQKNPKRLVYNLVYEFIKIKLTDDHLEFDTGDDTDVFIYLAGIYFGFGALLSQGLKDIGRADDGFWETKWCTISDMPYEVMAFALASYSTLIEENNPEWKNNLPVELKSLFEKAIQYLDENPSSLFDKNELEASKYFNAAHGLYLKNEFTQAIDILQKMLLITKVNGTKAVAFNNIGYYNLRLKNYRESIEYFQKSIQLEPNFGYANDNLGYALIQLGDLEEGKNYLEKALKTTNNDIAYTYRNFALYHQAKGETNQAESLFNKAFASALNPVDLLDYHFAGFLFQKNQKEKGLQHLRKAVEKGEPEAVEMMKTFEKK
jgi:tetratricopeptide (TPR) repeat protein